MALKLVESCEDDYHRARAGQFLRALEPIVLKEIRMIERNPPCPPATASRRELRYAMSDRPAADAVEAALQERFRHRRERGKWFRATPIEVRRAITERSIIDLYRPSEAGGAGKQGPTD